MENKPQKVEEIPNIMKNISSLYSSISDGFIRLNQYISQYQNTKTNKEKNKTIDLTKDDDKKSLNDENKNNNVIIYLNNNKNTSQESTDIIIKDEDDKIKNKDIKQKEDKLIKNKEKKDVEFNSFLKKFNKNVKTDTTKANKTEIKLPINNINNYYFKEINITNNNNISRCITESKKKKEKNDKEESKENIINLDEEEDQNKKKNKKGNKKKGYKFKIKFLDYYYTFGYYQSYNDAYYDKVKISKYFNEIDLFNLNYNEQFSYKNISIKLKEKYPLLSVKYLKNNINFETKIKIK